MLFREKGEYIHFGICPVHSSLGGGVTQVFIEQKNKIHQRGVFVWIKIKQVYIY